MLAPFVLFLLCGSMPVQAWSKHGESSPHWRSLEALDQPVEVCPDRKLTCHGRTTCVLRPGGAPEKNIFQRQSQYECKQKTAASASLSWGFLDNHEEPHDEDGLNATKSNNATTDATTESVSVSPDEDNEEDNTSTSNDPLFASTRSKSIPAELDEVDVASPASSSSSEKNGTGAIRGGGKKRAERGANVPGIILLLVTLFVVIVEICCLRWIELRVKADREADDSIDSLGPDPFGLPIRPSSAIDLTLAKAEAHAALDDHTDSEESDDDDTDDGLYEVKL